MTNVECSKRDLYDLGFPPASFDAVVCAEARTSRAVSRVLALTGFLSQRRLSSRILREALESAGFHVTREEILPGLIPVRFVAGVSAL